MLVNEQPEGNGIASVIAVAIQVGNFFLLVYLLVRHRLRRRSDNSQNTLASEQSLLALQVGCLNSGAFLATLAGAWLWRWTGNNWSYGVICIAVLSGGVGSLQNAILWPYVATFGRR